MIAKYLYQITGHYKQGEGKAPLFTLYERMLLAHKYWGGLTEKAAKAQTLLDLKTLGYFLKQ